MKRSFQSLIAHKSQMILKCVFKKAPELIFGGKRGAGGMEAKSTDLPVLTMKVLRTQLASPHFPPSSISITKSIVAICWNENTCSTDFHALGEAFRGEFFVENFIVLAIICGRLICSPVRVYIPVCDMIYFYSDTLWKGFLHDMFYSHRWVHLSRGTWQISVSGCPTSLNHHADLKVYTHITHHLCSLLHTSCAKNETGCMIKRNPSDDEVLIWGRMLFISPLLSISLALTHSLSHTHTHTHTEFLM